MEKIFDYENDNQLSIIYENILLQLHWRCLKAKRCRELFKLNLWNAVNNEVYNSIITNNEVYN